MIRVAVSGGFDPVHTDHICLFRQAKAMGDYLIVILNSDEWLMLKKGFVFMPLANRKEILESIKYVDEVIVAIDKDHTVCATLKLIKPDLFVKSGNRQGQSETQTCEEIKCKRIYVTTGTLSSTGYVMNALKQLEAK